MELTIVNIFWIGLYILTLATIAFFTSRKEGAREYIIADKQLSMLQATVSLVALLGAVVLVGQAALAYDIGYVALWLWAGFALGFFVLAWIFPKVKAISDKKDLITLSGYIRDQYGAVNGALAAAILFLAFFALLTGQFIAGASVLAPFVGISYSMAVLLLGFITLGYVLIGGFKVVVRTDVIQFLLMATIFILVLLYVDIFSITTPLVIDIVSTDFVTGLSLLVLGFSGVFAGADIWQRIIATRSITAARNAIRLSAIIFLFLGFAITVVGVAARNAFPNIDSGEALYYGLFELMPEALLGLIFVGVLAAIMSTIDTELFYLSSSVAKDFSSKKSSDEEIKSIIFKSLVVLAIFSMGIAIFVSDIVLLLFALLSLILGVVPTVLASIFWDLKKDAVFLSLSTGLFSFVALFFMGSLNPDTASITLPAAVAGLVLGQIFGRKR